VQNYTKVHYALVAITCWTSEVSGVIDNVGLLCLCVRVFKPEQETSSHACVSTIPTQLSSNTAGDYRNSSLVYTSF